MAGTDDRLRQERLAGWLKTRPASVQELAKEFPVGERYYIGGVPHHLLGYTDAGELILTPIHPVEDYAEAVKQKILVSASGFREGKVK
jgi:hypothetical protein